MARARESAGIISHLFDDIPVRVDSFLEEFNYGSFEGSFWWTQSEKNRQAWMSAMDDFSTAIPGGDSYETFSDRLWNGYQNFLANYNSKSEKEIIFVSHDAVISTLLFSILYGHPAKQDTTSSYKKAYLRFINSVRVANGSVTIVDLEKKPIRFEPLISEKASVPISNKSIRFYMNGMWKAGDVEITEKFTASENKVFHIENRESEKTAIIKLLEEREIVASERMVDIYTYLKNKTKISAPHLLFYDKSNAFFEDTVLVQDYLKGEIQNKFIKQHPEMSHSMLEKTFEMIQKIHMIPVADVEDFWYPEDASPHNVHAPWHSYMSNEIRRTIEAIPQMNLPQQKKEHLEEVLNELNMYVNNQQYSCVPIHGDLIPMNIVFTIEDESSSCARILDFERARIGDPLWDYAYYFSSLDLFMPSCKEDWQAILEAHFSPEKLSIIHTFRFLFHAWTVRDAYEYEGSDIRGERGMASSKWLIGALQ